MIFDWTNPAYSTNMTDVPPDGRAANLVQKLLCNSGMVRIGRIVDVHAGGYVASVNAGEGIQEAVWAGNVLCPITGTGDISIPTPGTFVVLLQQPSDKLYILSALPSIGSGMPINFDVDSSNVTFYTETQHNAPYDGNNALISNYNARRPMDSLPGDMGWMNDDGGVIALQRGTKAIVKASELAQVQCISVDDVLRLIGRNYQLWTDAGEHVVTNDEGEVNVEIFLATSQKETLGLYEDEEIGSNDAESDGGSFYKLDPDDRTGRWSSLLHAGHLGNLLHLWAMLPPEAEGKLGLDYSGNSEFFASKDGQITLRGKRGFRVEQNDKIRVPAKQKEPWDPEGDSSESGYEAIDPKGPFKYSDEHQDAKHLQESDARFYEVDYNEVEPYLAHKKDWTVPLEKGGPGVQATPTGATAGVQVTGGGAEEESTEPVENVSLFTLREDGSVYLEGPQGSSIELSVDGNIRIHAAKDILFEAGRDTVRLSGRNHVDKSQEHMECVSTKKAIRMKAKHSVQLVSKEQGVLIESKGSKAANGQQGDAQEFSGVMIKSGGANAPIILEARGDKVQIESSKHVTIKGRGGSSYIKMEASNFALESGQEGGEGKFDIKAKEAKLDFEKDFEVSAKNQIISAEESLGLASWGNFQLTGATNSEIWSPNTGFDEGLSVRRHRLVRRAGRNGVRQARPYALTSTPQEIPKVKDLTTPLHSEMDGGQVLASIKFSFLLTAAEYGWGSSKMYETRWQHLLQTKKVWNLQEDDFDGTVAWPGKGFSERYEYEDVNDGSTHEPEQEAGKFTTSSVEKYVVPQGGDGDDGPVAQASPQEPSSSGPGVQVTPTSFLS